MSRYFRSGELILVVDEDLVGIANLYGYYWKDESGELHRYATSGSKTLKKIKINGEETYAVYCTPPHIKVIGVTSYTVSVMQRRRILLMMTTLVVLQRISRVVLDAA